MKEFTFLKKIVESISDNEYRFIRDNLFQDGRKVDDNFSHKLFDSFRSRKLNTYEELLIDIDINIKYDSIRRSCSRLTERVLELISSNNCILDDEIYDSRAQEILSMRKKLIYFDILAYRGMNIEAKGILEKVIKVARRYEYLDVLSLALSKKRKAFRLSISKDELDAIKIELERVISCRDAVEKAEEFCSKLIRSANSSKEFTLARKGLNSIIQHLQVVYDRCAIATLLDYIYIFRIEKCEFEEDWINAHSLLKDHMVFINSNEAIYSKNRYGTAVLNYINSSICLFDFTEAAKYILTAKACCKNQSANLLVVYEMEFLLIYFNANLNSYKKFNNILIELANKTYKSEYKKNLISYYNSIVEFLDGNFQNTYKTLNNLKALEKDKEGWNIAIRILSIMCQIELENYELAESLIENLRKHVERVQKNSTVGKRDEKILKILISLSRDSFNFKKVAKKREKDLLLLGDQGAEYRFRLMKPEMIVFQEWFYARTQNQPYNHVQVMEKIRYDFYVANADHFVPLMADA